MLVCAGTLFIRAQGADASDFKVLPSLTVSEEYTDNAYLEPANPQEDYTTRIAPTLGTFYKSPLWDWDAAYTYDYRYHAETNRRDEKTQAARLVTLVRIIPRFLFLEVKDDYTRVSTDLVRDYTQESRFVSQTDRNIFSVNPYAVARLTEKTTMIMGYLYRSTWYKNPLSIDTVEHVGSAECRQEISQTLTISSGVRYTRNDNVVGPFTKTDVFTGPTYTYAEGASVAVSVGYSRFAYKNDGRLGQAFWDVRTVHKYSTLTATAEIGMTYLPDPTQVLRREDRFLAGIRKETERTTLDANGGVREYRNAMTNHLEITSYRASGIASYALNQKDRIIGSLIIERLEDEVLDTAVSRYLTGIRAERKAREDITWALEYHYANVYSRDSYMSNYTGNRFLVEVRKGF